MRLVAVCLFLLLVGAPAAHAACTSSTPASTTFADNPLDGEGSAPELKDVVVSLDAACTFSLNPGLPALGAEDAVIAYIGVGTAVDVVLLTLIDEGQARTYLGGADMVIDYTTPVGATSAAGAVTIAVDRLGIAPGATVNVRFFAFRFGEEAVGLDFAPEPDAPDGIALALRYDGTPAPGAAPVPGTGDPPAATPRPPILRPTTRCRVPDVKRRSRASAVARLRRGGCGAATRVTRRYSNSVRRGRVIGTTPGTGRRTTRPVTLIVSKGRRPR